jgi:cell division initiation protein
MKITPNDVENHPFKVEFRGFKRSQVRAFLSQVSEEMAVLVGEMADLREKADQLQHLVDDYRSREGGIQDALYAVRKLAEDIKKEAHRESDVIIREARMAADLMLQQARVQVSRIEEDISRLRLERDAFEDRVRLLAEEHLRLIDSRHREGEIRDRLKFLGARHKRPAAPAAPEAAPRVRPRGVSGPHSPEHGGGVEES